MSITTCKRTQKKSFSLIQFQILHKLCRCLFETKFKNFSNHGNIFKSTNTHTHKHKLLHIHDLVHCTHELHIIIYVQFLVDILMRAAAAALKPIIIKNNTMNFCNSIQHVLLIYTHTFRLQNYERKVHHHIESSQCVYAVNLFTHICDASFPYSMYSNCSIEHCE